MCKHCGEYKPTGKFAVGDEVLYRDKKTKISKVINEYAYELESFDKFGFKDNVCENEITLIKKGNEKNIVINPSKTEIKIITDGQDIFVNRLMQGKQITIIATIDHDGTLRNIKTDEVDI